MKAAVLHPYSGQARISLADSTEPLGHPYRRRPRAAQNRDTTDPVAARELGPDPRLKAFGLNRSELFTRRGESPGVSFPRILGIEATGIVEAAPGNESKFPKGTVVCTALGGMGRDFDGGYAEYTLVPAGQVQAINTRLPFEVLGALPEMLQTAYGSLFGSLDLKKGETLLVRGGTTSVGLAAAAIAKNYGAIVCSTSRSAERETLLKEHGADHVFVDDGHIASQVRQKFPDGVDKVLELIGVATMDDSMACTKQFGVVCITGIVGDTWYLDRWNPMEHIPKGIRLTMYGGGPREFMNTPLQELADQIAEGSLHVQVGKVFKLDDIVDAHKVMDANTAGGKIVVVT